MLSRGTTLAAALGVALLAMVGRAEAQTVTDPMLQVTALLPDGSLELPTTMAFVAPGDILVLEKALGRVRRIVGGVLSPTIALDLNVNFSSERGLLGIAVNSESPPRVFLYVTEAVGSDGGTPIANRVYRYTWNAGAGLLQSGQLILDLPVLPGPNHDGGVLALGPVPPPGPGQVGDGAILYAIIGDLNHDGQLQNNAMGGAPDETSVVFAVQQDGTPAPGNPFVPYCSVTTAQACPSGTGCPGAETCVTQVARYFAYGVRNSFGLAIDPVTGDLWDTENGPESYDEINRIPAGTNSGWNRIMGPDSRDPQGVGDLFAMPGGASTYSDPEFSWLNTIAPTAIVFPAGSALGTAYDGVALVGDANLGQIYRFPLNGTRDAFDGTALPANLQDLVADSATERNQLRLGQGFGGVTDLKIGPDGALYVVSIGIGTIYRIAPTGPTTTSSTVPTTSSTTVSSTTSTSATSTSSTTLPGPSCPAAPTACRLPTVAAVARVQLVDDPDPAKDLLVWRWLRGVETDVVDFGDPTTGTDYALCVYDGAGLVLDAIVPGGGTCGRGRPCWTRTARGFVYRDGALGNDGLQRIVLRAGVDGRAKIIVRAKGQGLGVPGLGDLLSPVTVQLRNGSVCWGAQYSFPPAIRSEAGEFRDRAD